MGNQVKASESPLHIAPFHQSQGGSRFAANMKIGVLGQNNPAFHVQQRVFPIQLDGDILADMQQAVFFQDETGTIVDDESGTVLQDQLSAFAHDDFTKFILEPQGAAGFHGDACPILTNQLGGLFACMSGRDNHF